MCCAIFLQKAIMDTPELEIFREHYAMFFDCLTDINTLLPYLLAEDIISLDDIDGNDVKSEKVKKLLSHILDPLRAGNTHGFYTLLKIMEQHGTQATRKLATIMRGLLPDNSSSTGKCYDGVRN